MIRVAWRGLVAHKLRLLMTSMSIALGVALMTGTLALGGAVTGSFAEAANAQYDGVDVVVRSASSYEDPNAAEHGRPIAASVVSRLTDVPGVVSASGRVSGFAVMVDQHGKTVGAGMQSNNGISVSSAGLDGLVEFTNGRAPRGAQEVAIDAGTAHSAGLSVGDTVRIIFRGPPGQFHVVGIARFGDKDRLGSTTTALFDLATAQRVLGKPGMLDEIRLRAAGNVDPDELRQQVARVLPGDMEAVTGAVAAAEQADRLERSVEFLTRFLMFFAGVAVLVGSFIIWNAFTIIVSQRTRELALLRAIGASRRQLRRAVLLESVATGILGSILGLLLGTGVARLLVLLLRESAGLEIADATAAPTPGALMAALAIGTAVTVAAAATPASRAMTVAPIAALRDTAPGDFVLSRRRAAAAGALAAFGAISLTSGLIADDGATALAVGSAASLGALLILLPLIARRLTNAIGSPLPRLFGTTGRLARDNAARNPRRTAATAAALMIGLGLIDGATVVAASLRESLVAGVDRSFTGDLVLRQAGGAGAGLSPDVARAARTVPGVKAVAEFGFGSARVSGTVTPVVPVDPTSIGEVIDLGMVSGSPAALHRGGVLVHGSVAEAHGWRLGSPVTFEWPQRGSTTLPVAGVFTERDVVGANYLVSLATFDRHASGRLDTMVALKTDEGSDVAQVEQAAVRALQPYADVEVLTARDFRTALAGQVDQLLLIVTALLLLAVLIALLGIVNTLALSMFERTRELGLLRAVGMTRDQVRSMVRWEALLVASVGAVTGTSLGLGLGLVARKALEDHGVSESVIPGTRLIVFAMVALAAGVLAAVVPARRAAKVDVLRAVVMD